MPDRTEDQKDIERRVLGRSLACPLINPDAQNGRDLTLSHGPNGTDLAVIDGLDLLGQTLSIALTTRQGDDIFNSEFGFAGLQAMAKEVNPMLAREGLRIAVVQVLRRDPRVSRIVDIKLEDGRLELPTPGGRREFEVRVAFETVSGQQSNVKLGRLIRQ